jgi:isoleucyl-tRNA synthetase
MKRYFFLCKKRTLYDCMKSLKITNYQEKYDVPKGEHEVLAYWDEHKTFERSVNERSDDKRYVFYDGPPFATGLPHYGHILASTIKDVIPRYWTMKGYRVDRVWGWDCHGVPIENIIEKELGLKGGKKGIEELGIDKFNDACRSAIMRFDKEWEKVIRRIGRWVDFAHSYKTMDRSFMESVWWAFKTLYDKGLVYEGRKVILYCPRCATPLSNFEIAMDNSYKDVQDNSLFVKFAVKGKPNEYLVAWTTTPWTLIGNVALAVDEDADYVAISQGEELLWMAASRVMALEGSKKQEQKMCKGKDLVGWEYEPLYPYMPLEGKKAHYVTGADFVSLSDGSGIVHTAAIFGEDDYRLAVQNDLPRVPTLDDQGKFLPFVTPLSGVFYKKAEEWVIEDLARRNLVYRAEKITHSYPFCYRCETPLYFNAVPAWFIDVQKIKPDLSRENEAINWYPHYLKHGRFGKGLEGAPDWNISRSRYWGTPMPVWKEKSSEVKVRKTEVKYRIVGSVEELKKWAVDKKRVENITDIHREFLDDIELWVDDEKTVKGKRIPEVFDCWIESGSMPFASIHYPFEHKKLFTQSHPAQFIAEYIAQTRAWFYTLHVMSVGLFGKHTFENAVTTGTILAADGAKMSKSKKNFPDPAVLMEKYGVDALRFYLMGSVVMKAENLNFSEDGVKETYQKIITILWNVFSFYKLYVKNPVPDREPTPVHVMDRWVISNLHGLVDDLTVSMDSYDTVGACRYIQVFISDLSTWYLRRSRDRVQTDTRTQEVFGWVLHTLMKLIAPVMPFISERIYQNLMDTQDSVHLSFWPVYQEKNIDEELEEEMIVARQIVERAHAVRKELAIKLRQPLAKATVTADRTLSSEVLEVIREEIHVLSVDVQTGGQIAVEFDTTLTPELIQLGKAREVIREIQVLRKAKGCKIDEQVSLDLSVDYKSLSESLLAEVKRETLVKNITWSETTSIHIISEKIP